MIPYNRIHHDIGEFAETMKIHWIGLAASALLVALAGYVGGIAVALLVLPLFAWYAGRILVHGGFDLWHHARQGSMKEWNGRYYEFGGVQLRAEELDDGLAFVEADLLKVIEQPRSKTVELFGPAERIMLEESGEMALTQAGCERLLLKCPHRDAKKLMLFLQREAFFPHAKKHGRHLPGIADNPPKAKAAEERT